MFNHSHEGHVPLPGYSTTMLLVEGPSLVILREELSPFVGKRVGQVSGNTSVPVADLKGTRLASVKTWGKHLLLTFGRRTLRIHFMLFGTYAISTPKEGKIPRIAFRFGNGCFYCYACSVKFLEDAPEHLYDWRTDLMSEAWDKKLVEQKVKEREAEFVCDALLDQDVFTGSGNIIKNEVLFLERLHPLTPVSALSSRSIKKLAGRTREYAFTFYEWKKKFVLREHWNVHRKGTCPRCGRKLAREKLGRLSRMAYYCASCQQLKR